MFGSDWQSEAISANVFTGTPGVLPANHRHNTINPRYTRAEHARSGRDARPSEEVEFETRPISALRTFSHSHEDLQTN